LAVFNEINGLEAAPGDFPFFEPARPKPPCVAAAPGERRAIGRRGGASVVAVSLLPRFPFFRKKLSRRPGERGPATPAGARAIRAKPAASPKRRRTGPRGHDGSPPTSAIGRETESRRMGASRPPSIGKMRLAWRGASPCLRRATWHNDAPPLFKGLQRRLRLAANSNRGEHEGEIGGGSLGCQKGQLAPVAVIP
jgi:hypothetical protein